jgi:hypothetical protein
VIGTLLKLVVDIGVVIAVKSLEFAVVDCVLPPVFVLVPSELEVVSEIELLGLEPLVASTELDKTVLDVVI